MGSNTGDRIPVLALLDGGEHDYARSALPLLRSLGASRHLHVDTITRQEDLRPAGHKILLVASDRPLRSGLAVEIADFVRRGGGLILLHGTLAAWSSSGELAELARWAPGDVGRLTELVIRPDESHPLTRRLGSEWKVRDELYLSEGPPGGDAKVLLRSRWRFTDQVVAYERCHGEGRFVYVGLGHDASTFADERFQLLVHRAVLHASGAKPAAPVGVGLVGYGAIARDHASAIAAIPGLQLTAVCDLSAERRDQASRDWAVRTFASSEQMLDDAAVGLVVVGTPPSAHSDSVLAALAAGKHVVCEKPFALRVDEVDRMIASAATRNAVLTVYQSRRWDPDYLAMRDVVRSGRIGDVFYLESFIGGFSHPCDFWHSHEPISGGTIYDWGSHYFDWILQLFPDTVRSVSAVAHKRVWHDVTNADQVRVDLTFAGGAQAVFLQSDIAAALKPKWYVLGTEGAVVGEWQAESVPADHPAHVTVLRPAGTGSHEESLVLAPRDDQGFYRNLADHLEWDEPLAVTPEEARRTVAVMEAATHSIARGGAPIEVDI